MLSKRHRKESTRAHIRTARRGVHASRRVSQIQRCIWLPTPTSSGQLPSPRQAGGEGATRRCRTRLGFRPTLPLQRLPSRPHSRREQRAKINTPSAKPSPSRRPRSRASPDDPCPGDRAKPSSESGAPRVSPNVGSETHRTALRGWVVLVCVLALGVGVGSWGVPVGPVAGEGAGGWVVLMMPGGAPSDCRSSEKLVGESSSLLRVGCFEGDRLLP
jgi:hypothetical protein